jgi:hypothetical protein
VTEVWQLDPEKGFVVTQARADITTNGRTWTAFKYSIDARKVEGTAIYFPVMLNFEELAGFDAAGNVIRSAKANVHLTNIKVDPPLPEHQFDLSNLELGPQVKLFTTDASGKEEVLWRRNGSYVPMPIGSTTQQAPREEGGE